MVIKNVRDNINDKIYNNISVDTLKSLITELEEIWNNSKSNWNYFI